MKILFASYLISFGLITASFAADPPGPGGKYLLKEEVPPVLESDVVKLQKKATIVLHVASSRHEGAYYPQSTHAVFIRQGEEYYPQSTSKMRVKNAWIRWKDDWVEPVTPPDASGLAPLGPRSMRVMDVIGQVSIIAPDGNQPLEITEPTEFPDGATLKTGKTSSAAVLIGGINSVRLGPESSISIHYTGTDVHRITTITLDEGCLFSKVGNRTDRQQTFKVQSSMGSVTAKGTDFFTMKWPTRMDVLLVQGTLELRGEDDALIDTVSATKETGIEAMRVPIVKDAVASVQANSDTLVAALSLMPLVNAKINHLKEKMKTAAPMTAAEAAYYEKRPQITYLRELQKSEPESTH